MTIGTNLEIINNVLIMTQVCKSSKAIMQHVHGTCDYLHALQYCTLNLEIQLCSTQYHLLVQQNVSIDTLWMYPCTMQTTTK